MPSSPYTSLNNSLGPILFRPAYTQTNTKLIQSNFISLVTLPTRLAAEIRPCYSYPLRVRWAMTGNLVSMALSHTKAAAINPLTFSISQRLPCYIIKMLRHCLLKRADTGVIVTDKHFPLLALFLDEQ